jgi:hypothetical protein
MHTLDLSSNSKFDKEISELFTKICYNNCIDFNSLIKKLIDNNNTYIDLLVCNPTSRNTHNSNLYMDYCKVQLVKEIIIGKKVINEIIVDSKALKNVLIQLPGLSNTKFIIEKGTIRTIVQNYLINIALPFTAFLTRVFQLVLFKMFFSAKLKNSNSPITLIDTFALPGYYSKDRYYNGLWESLNNEEKKDIYFIPTIVMTKWNKIYSAYNDLLKAERQFLFKESFLKYSDLLFAVTHHLRVQFIKINGLEFNGIDYLPLVKEDLRHRAGYGLAIGGLINYRFVKRLKEKKININRVIDWWESQALDKGLHKGLNDYYPDVPVVGYLGYVPRNMDLQLYPTEYEQENGVVPKEIAAIGKGFINGLKVFNPNQKVGYAPAFRFQHLWNGGPCAPAKDNYTILIALPFTFNDSIYLIEQMILCSNEICIESMRFMIKPHPILSKEKIKSIFGKRWPRTFEFTQVDTQIALRKVDIVVSGMSSICLEAMALGVPVIAVEQPNGLQNNPIPEEIEQDLWKPCNSVKSILAGINHYKGRDEEEKVRHYQLGLKIRKTYFEPVSRVGVLKILGIEGDSTIGKS